MSNFTLEDLFNYRRKGAGGLVDAYEQLQKLGGINNEPNKRRNPADS